MSSNPLKSLSDYSHFVAELIDRTTVKHSTLFVWPESPYTGVADGEFFFDHGFRLRVREELDFDAAMITSYGYEVYRDDERIYWYDDFPHPNDPSLAPTHPHHKHVHPDIKHNRIPAPGLSFTQPNLPAIIKEIEELMEGGD
ncbi:MAG TPA: DUF6516 family protein [Blastocatellia bacterium]|nr:DUF6516 family protein [Blastocatellia bacterium]